MRVCMFITQTMLELNPAPSSRAARSAHAASGVGSDDEGNEGNEFEKTFNYIDIHTLLYPKNL
jgi:hypothetical protein